MVEVEYNDSTEFKPHLIIRLIPAAYKREWLPEEFANENAAIEFAVSRAKRWNRKICLAWTEQVTVWIDEQGRVYGRKVAQPGEDHVPAMEVKGKRFVIGENGFEEVKQ